MLCVFFGIVQNNEEDSQKKEKFYNFVVNS